MKSNKVMKTVLLSCVLSNLAINVSVAAVDVDQGDDVKTQNPLHSSRVVKSNGRGGVGGASVLVAGIGAGALVGLVPVLYFRHQLKNEAEKREEGNKKLEKLLNDLIEKSNSPKCVRHSIDIEDVKKQLEKLLEEYGLADLMKSFKGFKGLGIDDFIKKGEGFFAGLGGAGRRDSAGGEDGDDVE